MDSGAVQQLAPPFCSECGTKQQSAGRFCPTCGVDFAVAEPAPPVAFGSVGDDLVDDPVTEDASQMTVGKAWVWYGGSILLLVVTGKFLPFEIALALYWVFGFVMTKIVMGGLIEWHPVHNTISNVFSAKVGMFFLWPIQMLILLLKLSVIKVL